MFSILRQSFTSTRSVYYARIAITMLVALSLWLALPRQVSVASNTTLANASEKMPDKKVKSFRGDAVKQHIEKRRLKNKGLSRAIKEYSKRGLSPKWDDSVTLQQVAETGAVNNATTPFQRASYLPQETYVEGDTEITFITFSGDLNYWDGVVYVHTPYQDDTYSGDFLTPTDDGTSWDVVNEVYYPPDGGTPCDGSRACMLEEQRVDASPVHKQQVRGKAGALTNHSSSPVRPGLWGWLKGWWGCTRIGCAIGYAYCPGNYRFICRVAVCVYSAFACL